MDFAKESRVSHPASAILDVMIREMESIVPFLPSVERIETLSKEELPDDRVRIVRRWQGAVDSLPGALRRFIPPEILAWTDTAVWTPADYKVDWSLETALKSVSDLYDCGGVNYFEPHPDAPKDHSRIRITGSLVVYPNRLPGVPRLLASTIGPQVEKLIVGLLTPNLTEVASGLQGYLDQRRKPGKRPRR